MLEFRLLGPLEVVRDGAAVPLAGRNQRALLTLLVLHRGEVVSSDRLVDALWGEAPPPTALTSLQNTISQLRKTLGAHVLETRPPGYRLAAEPSQVDAAAFDQGLRDARTLPAAERCALLRRLLSMWRGAALADVADESFAQSEDPAPRGAAHGGARGLPRGRGGGGVEQCRPRRGARRPRHPAPVARTPARLADGRAVPRGAPGQGTRGLSGCPSYARRRARHRAWRRSPAPVRRDPAPRGATNGAGDSHCPAWPRGARRRDRRRNARGPGRTRARARGEWRAGRPARHRVRLSGGRSGTPARDAVRRHDAWRRAAL